MSFIRILRSVLSRPTDRPQSLASLALHLRHELQQRSGFDEPGQLTHHVTALGRRELPNGVERHWQQTTTETGATALLVAADAGEVVIEIGSADPATDVRDRLWDSRRYRMDRAEARRVAALIEAAVDA